MTLGDRLTGHDNALNLVRLVLAVTVVLSHTWPLGGFGDDPSVGGLGLGTWAVAGFFALSGYLVSASRARSTGASFLAARALRIFPGYGVALLVVAVVLAPLAAAVSGTDVDLAGGARYVLGNLTTVTTVPAFGEAIHRSAYSTPLWNGAIWTLPYELACYLAVAVVFAVRRRATGLVLMPPVVTLMLLTATNVLLTDAGLTGRGSMVPGNLSRMGAYFAAGAVLWALRDAVRVDDRLAALAGVLLVALAVVHRVDDLGALPLAYLVLWAGARLPARWGRGPDLSYGLYIYGWPVQTLLSIAGGRVLGPLGFGAAALLGAGGLAALSWRFVEAPALRLRRRRDRHEGAVRTVDEAPAPPGRPPQWRSDGVGRVLRGREPRPRRSVLARGPTRRRTRAR